jgi:hypothetical protein
MAISHCKLDYHKVSVATLENKATQVATGIYGNDTPFSSPPLNEAEFTHIQTDFDNAAADYVTYGAVKKTAFTNAQKKLVSTMDLLATFVDGIANGDESLIILSGFTPTSSIPQNNIPLNRVDTFMLKRTTTPGEILVEIPAIKGHGAIAYFCICSEGIPIDAPLIVDQQLTLDNITNKVRYDFSKSRKKVFKALTPGTTYYFYSFGCNTVSVAPISEVRSIMAV